LIAELVDFVWRDACLAQRLGHVVDDGKIINGTGKLHDDFGMSSRHAAPYTFGLGGITRPLVRSDELLNRRLARRGIEEMTYRRFEIWLRVWASERIWPVGGLLDYQEQEHMAERRAAELIQFATEMGFEDSLQDKVVPYGSVIAYVQQARTPAVTANVPEAE
jgi:hypothetical protein